MNEIEIPSEIADSVYEISKRTNLNPDLVSNLAISTGLCSLHHGILPSSGGGGASQLGGTARGQRLPLSPEAGQP
tara:strand:- start:1467 stop:1691 length:225 start_codon:yes stop_codon:yes gene_type:complete